MKTWLKRYMDGGGLLIFFAVMLLLAVAGCGKQEAPAPAAGPAALASLRDSASHVPVAQPVPATSPVIAGSTSAEAAAEQMSAELRKYVAYTRTIPKNFEEFAAKHPMKFPAAPAGKKYAIEGAQVVVR